DREYKETSKHASRQLTHVNDAVRRAYFKTYLNPLDRFREKMRDHELTPTESEMAALEVEMLLGAKEEAKAINIFGNVDASKGSQRMKDGIAHEYLSARANLRSAERSQVPREITRRTKDVELFSKAVKKAGLEPDS